MVASANTISSVETSLESIHKSAVLAIEAFASYQSKKSTIQDTLDAIFAIQTTSEAILNELNDLEKTSTDSSEEVNASPIEEEDIIEDTTGVYPTEEQLALIVPEAQAQAQAEIEAELETQTSGPSVSHLPSEIQLDTINHLMFVIHGIGEHTDFQDGKWEDTPELVGENPVFRDLFRTTRDAFLAKEVPLALEIQSIEWHEELHATGVDPVFDMIAPEGSDKIRQFNKRAFMDLLYYTAPKFNQLIVNSVTTQLNAKYKRFMQQHPGWNGQVSIFSHSLGTIIAYDILTHEAGEVSDIGVKFTGLDFPVENFFCAGSPVPVMVLSRGDVNLSPDGTFTEGIKLPRANHYYNLFHPLDPIAYRIEPLIKADTAEVPAVQLLAADALKNKSFGELVELYDTAADPSRHDFVLRRLPHEGILNLAYAPFSHSSYWTSQDVVLFTLLQICRPAADKVRHYIKGSAPKPVLVPRHLTVFSPHKRPRLATTAEIRDRSSGGWYQKPVFLGHRAHLYYVSQPKEIACSKRQSIVFTANTHVEAVPTDPLAFKVYPDRTSTLYSVLPPNSSTNATQVMKAASTKQRDEWVAAIRQVLDKLQHSVLPPSSTRTDGLVLPSGSSVEYFGAVKTSVLHYVWGSKWFVLTQTGLDCYDAVPHADKWHQFTFSNVFVSIDRQLFRFVEANGTALSMKIQDDQVFQLWLKHLRDTNDASVVVDDTIA